MTIARAGAELLRAVEVDPTAEAPRAVYIDWLEEVGRAPEARFLSLEAGWRLDPAPGPALSELSRLATQLDPAWICAVSAIRYELRGLLVRFAEAFPWACDPDDIDHPELPWPSASRIRAFFASRVGPRADRFCWPLDHRLLLTLVPGIASTSRPPVRTSDRVAGSAEVTARTLDQRHGSDLPVERLLSRGLWLHAETDDWGRGIYLAADTTRFDFGAARRSAVHPWYRLRLAPQPIRRSTLSRWRRRVALLPG